MKILVLFCVIGVIEMQENNKPHIIFLMSDDMGWNDVGFHGSNQIPTPNIDALAYDGIILNNYYVSPICTPSRSALMTGKHPIHTGMQHNVLIGTDAWGLSLEEKLLPQYLKELEYTTRMVGKWHLGCMNKEYLPSYRGFDSHYGFWMGHTDYYDHTANEDSSFWGYDLHRELNADWEEYGNYATDILTREAVSVIQNHNETSSPLFLYMAYSAVHAGNTYQPLQAPRELVDSLPGISDEKRRIFGAMMNSLDTSVGTIVEALEQKRMLNNSIIVFTTDNGGATNGYDGNVASNWPLRGGKNTMWEGGVRGAAAICSPLLSASRRVSMDMAHVQDWLPTLIAAAGGDTSDDEGLDGINLWPSLLNGSPGPRQEVLHNIDDISGFAALRVGEWKIIIGEQLNGNYDDWYGATGRDGDYNTSLILDSPVAKALLNIGRTLDISSAVQLRESSVVDCEGNAPIPCNLTLGDPCLFNIINDPCEEVNLAKQLPDIVTELMVALNRYNETAVEPRNGPFDPFSNPKYWGYAVTNWKDFPQPLH